MAIEPRHNEASTATELQAQIDQAKPGSVIQVGAGRIRGRVVIAKPIQLGGAIFVGADAKAEIAATIIAENIAIRGGGIAAIDGAEIDVFTSRLLANRAELEGHHIYTHGTSGRNPQILLSNTVVGQAEA